MKLVLALILVTLATPLALLVSPAYAQIELTDVDPPDGAMLDLPPSKIRLCFSRPVDLEDGAFFRFRHSLPDDRTLVLPVTVQPDAEGECVEVSPGYPADPPEGEYTLEWRVTAAEGDEEGSGTLRFQIAVRAPRETATPEQTAQPSGQEGGNNDGPDILFMALITLAGVGGAAVLFSLGYFLRRRIGYDPHRPPEGGEESEGH